jgi:hypothetical protein
MIVAYCGGKWAKPCKGGIENMQDFEKAYHRLRGSTMAFAHFLQ